MDTRDGRRAAGQEREIARWLLAREAGDNQSPGGLTDGALKVFDRLHVRLSGLIGPIGYESLLRRALYLAQSECSLLARVKAGPAASDAWLDGLRDAIDGRHPDDVRACLVALVANFILLLSRFIGLDFTVEMIRSVWPDYAPGSGDAGSEEKDR